MITPAIQTRPLDFDVSLKDFFDGFSRYTGTLSNKIQYDYKKITIEEPIGAILSAQELLFYPTLAKKIRQLKQLCFQVSIDLPSINTYRPSGLMAITESLHSIEQVLSYARVEKARLDSEMNNLIYLYGQRKELPILQDVKPYFHRDYRSYRRYKTNTYRLTISSIRYWLNYQTKRFGELASLYLMNEHSLLSSYFETTKKEPDAIRPAAQLKFLGGVLNTPIYVFRVKYNFKQKGKKYYIDLADNKTYTKITDVREKAMLYTKKHTLKFITESS